MMINPKAKAMTTCLYQHHVDCHNMNECGTCGWNPKNKELRETRVSKATQKAKILNYCAKHGSITIREAFEQLHINSPSKRISELRQQGYNVQADTEIKVNAQGEEIRFRRYYITESEGAYEGC